MAAFCSACGGSLPEGARFCPACGKEVVGGTYAGAHYAPTPMALIRPRAGRKVAGICQALANQYGWDITWTRVVTALFIVLTPFGLIAYLLFWLLMPEEPQVLPPTTTSLNTVS
jgi:phage shock protein C